MMAEDLKTVLDTLGVKKAHFLGFSDGGNLANQIRTERTRNIIR